MALIEGSRVRGWCRGQRRYRAPARLRLPARVLAQRLRIHLHDVPASSRCERPALPLGLATQGGSRVEGLRQQPDVLTLRLRRVTPPRGNYVTPTPFKPGISVTVDSVRLVALGNAPIPTGRPERLAGDWAARSSRNDGSATSGRTALFFTGLPADRHRPMRRAGGGGGSEPTLLLPHSERSPKDGSKSWTEAQSRGIDY